MVEGGGGSFYDEFVTVEGRGCQFLYVLLLLFIHI
jgi:hypothetical protein